ncbi:MAG: T9SS type B sorting domain-containing protein [Crocinitomix sp.]|nr:T9SS type B sorting domain-containing protein [Crocinitomix sp.]
MKINATKKLILLILILLSSNSGQSQTCIPLTSIDGAPAVFAAPTGWSTVGLTPDIVAGEGPYPGGGGYVISEVEGFSLAGGEMSLLLAFGVSTEGIETTLTGLTPGFSYSVSLEWQQATLANDDVNYSQGRLAITVDGDETLFTSDGGVDDAWQVASVTFVASGATATFLCEARATEAPGDRWRFCIVVDDYPCIDGMSINVLPAVICEGDCADLEALTVGGFGEITYEWSPGIVDTDANVTVCPDETTVYQVIGTDEGGLTDTVSVIVIVNENPEVDLGPDAFLVDCIGAEITLDAENEGATYEWQDGSGSQTYIVTEPGIYWVTVTNELGCESTDTIEVFITDAPDLNANIEFMILGVSSQDGATGGCFLNPVQFNDISIVGDPGIIVAWHWVFGDGDGSYEENPEHTYDTEGVYTITLTVTTNQGCTDTYSIDIIMTAGLELTFLVNDPTCFGFSDGSITVNVDGAGDGLIFIITDDEGTEVNEAYSNTANTLNSGWYYFDVSDEIGCGAIDSIFLNEPDELAIDLTISDPLCYGFSTGWARVDAVYNATGEYDEIAYIWSPNPADVGGIFADSSYNMGAGAYTLTINDDNGCSKVFDFVIEQPDSMFLSEFGSEPAYCRLHEYQSGNGVVFGAAGGGTADYDYLWTNLETGETGINSTWGGRNPGNYELTVMDANGCVLKRSVFLDSLNPIADFSVTSDQLNEDLKGTAPVEALFTNLSENFANPNNPSEDTTFFWNLNKPIAAWQVSHDYFEVLDTTYLKNGQTYLVDVCLVVLNKNGCSDTACQVITIFEPKEFLEINIFTPNGDGINDVFSFEFNAASINEFNCVIVNRWGVVVHEMNAITDGWDGTDKSGSPCKDGTYFYTYKINTDDGTDISGQGTVQVVTHE